MEENKNEELKNEEVVENTQVEEVKEEVKSEETTTTEEVKEDVASSENEGAQDNFLKKNEKWIKIGGIAVAAIIILLIILSAFSRSPKATVKQFVKGMNSHNAKKVMDTIDFEGAAAYVKTYKEASKKSSSSSSSFLSSSKKEVDMAEFKDNYKEVMDEIKDMDKDEKKEYKENLKEAQESMQEALDEMKDEKVKMSVKVTKVSDVKGSKMLKEVTADVSVKEDGDTETKTMKFITMKKGLKNYIVSGDLLSAAMLSASF